MRRYILTFIFTLVCIALSAQTHYWYGTVNQNITIKDSDYYRRLDEIEQEEYGYYCESLKKAVAYYRSGDYESTIHYSKEGLKNEDLKGSAWCNIAASYANLGQQHKSTKAYSKGYKRMDPEMRRSVQDVYKKQFGKEIKRKRWIGRTVALGVLATAAVAGTVGGVISLVNAE